MEEGLDAEGSSYVALSPLSLLTPASQGGRQTMIRAIYEAFKN